MRLKLSSKRLSLPFSLRLQVTVWYTTAFAALLVLTGAVFYQYLERSLEASVDTDLQLRTQQVASGILLTHGAIDVGNVTGDLAGFAPQTPGVPQPSADVNTGGLVRVLNAHGGLLGETPAFRTLQVPTASITQPLQGIPWQGTVHSRSDQEVRLYSRTLTLQGKLVAVIQVGEELSHLHRLLHSLVAALFVVGLLVLVCCAAGSYWLAARSFAPIQRLSETARKIQAGDLHQRVPVPAVRDEVHYLAVTLNEMLTSLDQSFTRQRQFVADASHELRTPIAVIRNKAGIALLDPPQLEETVTVLQEIRSETERLSLLLTNLLTLARGDEEQAPLEREVVVLDRLVETVAAATEALAAQQQVWLEVQIPHPISIMGDEARLIQVVMNLLENAIRYTNPGGRVRIELAQTSTAVHLTVRDTGIGIAPEHLPHIFERFYRAAPVRRQTEGSGLGLSIVAWIVRSHGGSIAVESQVGRGSCFTITLPLLLPPQ